MMSKLRQRGRLFEAGGIAGVLAAVVALAGLHLPVRAGFFDCNCHKQCDACSAPEGVMFQGPPDGTWYWLRSPEEEKRVVMGLFNRYCIRCHGVDGRGVWDIPGIPDFTNVRWQESRSDVEIARIILEGRGAVMPPFRGALTLEEAWGLARYLRTFVPGTEVSRPDLSTPPKPKAPAPPDAPARQGALEELPPALTNQAVVK
jgi:hypothetical protein